MMLPIPVQSHLVTESDLTIPAGFTRVTNKLLTALPHEISLTADISLVLVMPTGLAVTWREIDPTTLVSHSEAELQPFNPSLRKINLADAKYVGEVTRHPLRCLVRQGGTTIASVPLVAGLHRTIPDYGSPSQGALLELIILSWDIRAGSLRGPGDFGATISLAWRLVGQGANTFSPASFFRSDASELTETSSPNLNP
ncbi:hypothetical protein N836_24160 [Leptolyngbya sp. Heron Island J]|uniref:hypothetical protein n=1 Tax=Leptolyngbya sp. Heron Island J TaxID=1385935 RepID=UPI0003B9946D|nr:hypothetical protein [Leptolyngbya sp. Heron Island J]ESA32885.1 hypothetical protein N836_24160 [Leptolyngbya sp. Heron Island J]